MPVLPASKPQKNLPFQANRFYLWINALAAIIAAAEVLFPILFYMLVIYTSVSSIKLLTLSIRNATMSFILISKKARKYVETVTGKVIKGFVDELSGCGVSLLNGFAAFTDNNCIEITMEDGNKLIQFEKAIIATGSNNMGTNVPSTKKLLDTTNIFDLEAAPKSVVVVGGGFIGTEYATFFKRIGSEVTIIEKSDRLLSSIDAQVVKEFEDQFRKSGVDILKGVSVDRIEKSRQQNNSVS